VGFGVHTSSKDKLLETKPMKVIQVINRTFIKQEGTRITRYLAKISINDVEGLLRLDQKINQTGLMADFYCDIPDEHRNHLTLKGVENVEPTEPNETPEVLIHICRLGDYKL